MSSVMPQRKVFILVMGLTGGGKSTFLQRATGNGSIPIGDGLESKTHDIAEYIIEDCNGYEVHLIDTPGFDDDSGLDDARVLQDIADWINYIYKDGDRISGLVYIHDITNPRIRGSGIRNIRMLEELLGRKHWERCTLVTTKWGETRRPDLEASREIQLAETDDYWKKICSGPNPADMKRFDNTKESALEIISSYLMGGFVPQITTEMVDPEGPKLSLGTTGAGKQISEYLGKLEIQQGKTEKIRESNRILEEKFNEKKYQLYRETKRRLITQQRWKRGIRWTLRLVTLGGCIAATVVTFGATAGIFGALGVLEVGLQAQKQDEKQKLEDLAKDYYEGSARPEWNASCASVSSVVGGHGGEAKDTALGRKRLQLEDTSTTSLLENKSVTSSSSWDEGLGTQREEHSIL